MSTPAPSAVPKRPTSSVLQDQSAKEQQEKAHNQEQQDQASLQLSPSTIPGFRQPVLRVEFRDARHPATRHFLSNFCITSDLDDLVLKVVNILYRPRNASRILNPNESQRKGSWQTIGSDGEDQDLETDGNDNDATSRSPPSRTIPHDLNIPRTRSVTLVVRDMSGVAYTTGLDLDDAHKEIHFAFDHISDTAEDADGGKDRAAIRHELLGVVCHELVHCYQDYKGDSIPGGLVEGIADWVRLHAGYVPPHWRKEAGDKVKWDAGYQTTGYFLDWLDDTYGEGSVRKINQRLMGLRKYSEKTFWNEQFGKGVKELWADYSQAVARAKKS